MGAEFTFVLSLTDVVQLMRGRVTVVFCAACMNLIRDEKNLKIPLNAICNCDLNVMLTNNSLKSLFSREFAKSDNKVQIHAAE